jgi:hypothetical protein
MKEIRHAELNRAILHALDALSDFAAVFEQFLIRTLLFVAVSMLACSL